MLDSILTLREVQVSRDRGVVCPAESRRVFRDGPEIIHLHLRELRLGDQRAADGVLGCATRLSQ